MSGAKPKIEKAHFGVSESGKNVEIYTLTNLSGAEVKFTTFGGRIVSLKVPDKNGKFDDVVLGYDKLKDYLNDNMFFGAIIGRYGNRIAKGKFLLNKKEYTLAKNDRENHLHGGINGFHRVIWEAEIVERQDSANLELTYLSKDSEEDYPGNLSVKVIYSLSENNELKIEYAAETDQDTIVNLTNHAYFNLAGSGTILDHQLQINADKFTPTNNGLIPTGELRSVKNSPFDFNSSTAIGARINESDEQLKFGNGYDHNWILNKKAGEFALAASVFEPNSRRRLEVFTTEPGIQFYAGNSIENVRGKEGKIYQKNEGFCLETQHFPDSPNQTDFPSVTLKKDETYSTTTVYKFSVE
jgi:aldose 1-epimerase